MYAAPKISVMAATRATVKCVLNAAIITMNSPTNPPDQPGKPTLDKANNNMKKAANIGIVLATPP